MKTTTMKKFMASIAALTMTAAIAAPAAMNAFADTKISIEGSANVEIAGKTFNIYRIAKATQMTDANGEPITDKYNYEILNAYLTPFEALLADISVNHESPAFYEKLDEKLNSMSADEMQKLAADLADIAKTQTVTKEVNSTTGYTNIDLVEDGYYLIVDTTEGGVKSAYMLNTFKSGAITIKADKPSIEKKVRDYNETSWSEANNAGIGQTVEYQITADVPNMIGYDKYQYIITDTLSKGLTLDESTIEITIGGTTLYKAEASKTDGHIGVNTEYDQGADGDTIITISWENLLTCYKEHYNKEWDSNLDIVVTYSATVNDKAVIGKAGNPNEVTLSYSTDPTTEGGGTTETTPPEYTKTYVGSLEIYKAKGDNTPLTGVSFKLTDKQGKVSYYVNVEGSGKVTVSETRDALTGDDIKQTTDHSVTAYVDSAGKLVFEGLEAGDYTITEIEAPNGYNKVPAFDVTLKCTVEQELKEEMTKDGQCEWSYTIGELKDVTDSDGTITVINRQGGLFPSTGGIGTTIFYTVGIAMLAGAGALVVFKRKSAEK